MMSDAQYNANPRSYGSLKAARQLLSHNSAQRDKILDCLIEIEKTLQEPDGVNIREDLTGPLVDLLFEDGELLSRTVEGGMTFNFRYSSKISRDFLLARGRIPDHVWEPQTTRSVIALSKGRQAVLIGGAYIGDHALYAARALAAGGVCHCFELSNESLVLLKSNLAANAIANVRVNQEALWSVDDAIHMQARKWLWVRSQSISSQEQSITTWTRTGSAASICSCSTSRAANTMPCKEQNLL
jgi:hypothetical protein